MHKELGNQGIEETYCQMFLLCWWEGLERDICECVKLCEQCRKRDPTLPKELGTAMGENPVFRQFSMGSRHIKGVFYKK